MTTRLVMSFAWMVVLATLSSSSASSLLNETRIEALDIEQLINEIRGIHDVNQIKSGAFDIKKNRGKKVSPKQCPDELNIAAFNIEALTKKKIGDDVVMKIISKIISLYHVILIQEVRCDEKKLVERLNKLSSYTYKAWASEPLGSSSYCERYVFLIRDGTGINLNKDDDTHQFDKNSPFFERPPFSIRLKCSDIQFVLTAIHTKPDAKKANAEITHLLDDVYQAILNKWNDTDNILMMGDLNAGYLTRGAKEALQNVTDRNNQTFDWLFGDDIATTVCSKKPHDRFIMTQDLKTMLVDGSAKVFKFDKENDEDFKTIAACCVSDHYPIELTLELPSSSTNDNSKQPNRLPSSSRKIKKKPIKQNPKQQKPKKKPNIG